MNNIDKLRSGTKKKLVVVSIFTAIPIIILVLFELPFMRDNFVVYNDLVVLRYLIFALLEAYIISKIIYYSRILASNDFAEHVILKRNDERNSFIRMKTTSKTLQVFIYAVGLAMIISGFINNYIFYTLLGILISILLIYLSVFIYYWKKH